MTIWFLLESLKEALEQEFQGFLLWNKEMERVPINVFLQNLPAPAVGGEKNEPVFPYIVVRYTGAVDSTANEPGQATVIFVIGVYDKDSMYQGYKDVTNIQEKIRQFLLKKPIVSECFTLDFPLRCMANDDFSESTWPCFYGGIESKWSIPAVLQDLEGLL